MKGYEDEVQKQLDDLATRARAREAELLTRLNSSELPGGSNANPEHELKQALHDRMLGRHSRGCREEVVGKVKEKQNELNLYVKEINYSIESFGEWVDIIKEEINVIFFLFPL